MYTTIRTTVLIEIIPGPAELPPDFASQLKRHKEYKRRGPPSGRSSRCPDRPGSTRTRLSSRFDAEAPATKLPRQTPLPPPPPPPPSRALNPSRHPSSPTALSRRPLKRRAIAIPSTGSRRRQSENRGPRVLNSTANADPPRNPATAAPVRPGSGRPTVLSRSKAETRASRRAETRASRKKEA